MLARSRHQLPVADMEKQEESLRAIVRGRVQGVGFRFFVVQHADELELRGFVRNLGDGRSVEVVAEGPRPALEQLLARLRQGPPMAHVQQVDATWGQASGQYRSFSVR